MRTGAAGGRDWPADRLPSARGSDPGARSGSHYARITGRGLLGQGESSELMQGVSFAENVEGTTVIPVVEESGGAGLRGLAFKLVTSALLDAIAVPDTKRRLPRFRGAVHRDCEFKHFRRFYRTVRSAPAGRQQRIRLDVDGKQTTSAKKWLDALWGGRGATVTALNEWGCNHPLSQIARVRDWIADPSEHDGSFLWWCGQANINPVLARSMVAKVDRERTHAEMHRKIQRGLNRDD